jgi:hypothetical protein
MTSTLAPTTIVIQQLVVFTPLLFVMTKTLAQLILVTNNKVAKALQ